MSVDDILPQIRTHSVDIREAEGILALQVITVTLTKIKMLFSWVLLLLSAFTMVTGGHVHCDGYCSDHCCHRHNHHIYDCSACFSQCCPSHAAVYTTTGPAVYSQWSTCDEECGGGLQYRHCITNCPLQHMPEESQQCNTQPCPSMHVNGGWGTWSNWSSCSANCGSGHRTRTRVCDNPQPQHGGHYCHGHNTYTETCVGHQCPVHGGWGAWSNWSSCSASCGSGHRTRTRVCDNPTPQYGGHSCHGHNWDKDSCTGSNCPIQGGWGAWSNWSSCSASCGSGHRTRTRVCDNPTPQYGGHSCYGNNRDTEACTSSICARPTLHHCDKLSVLHALAEIDTTSKVTCLDNWRTETEDFLMQYCNAPNDTQLWHEGIKVLSICPVMENHVYMPVGTFNGHSYGNDNGQSFAGIFIGCNIQHTGFKIATKICGGVAEIIEIPLPSSYNHTSTGIIPNDPSQYHFIKWV